MRRRFPLMLRLSLALILTLAVPVAALVGVSHYMQLSIRLDMEERVERTLDMAINLEETLLREGAADMRFAAAAVAADTSVVTALTAPGAPLDLRRFQAAVPRADMVVAVDRQGVVVARATSDQVGDRVLLDGLVAYAISANEPQGYPALISAAELEGEGAAVRQLVDMPILKASGSTDSRIGGRVDTALALAGVAPIHGPGGEVVGAVIAADILNRDFRIVDEVKNWAPEGTPLRATIAMDGVRVTTNVKLTDPEGNEFEERALGTLYSDAVMESLAAKGVHRGRADVVGQWQRTIYRSLTDYQGRKIAAPYVGISEAYFATIGDKLSTSLRFVVAAGSATVLLTLLGALWVLYRGVVAPIRRLAGPEGTLVGARNDEIGDLAAVLHAQRTRWTEAAREMRLTAERLEGALEPLQLLAAARTQNQVAAPSAANLRGGAGAALEQLHQLSGAVRAIAEGVRSEERSIHYVARVCQEIAAGLQESRGTVEGAMADVAALASAARSALKQSGEFAAGLAVLRQSVAGRPGQPALEWLRDPSDLLANLAALSERVAGEVRSLVLIVQENQARLAFIQEEMNRVSGVVQTTAASTQAATQSAGEAIGWMEGMTSTAVAVADEVLEARTTIESAAAANRHLLEWCGQVQDLVRRFRQVAEELPPGSRE